MDDAFARELAAENAHVHDELAAVTAAIQQQLAADAILPTGELKLEYRQNSLPIVNGASATPGVASLDPLFKRLMVGEGV